MQVQSACDVCSKTIGHTAEDWLDPAVLSERVCFCYCFVLARLRSGGDHLVWDEGFDAALTGR